MEKKKESITESAGRQQKKKIGKIIKVFTIITCIFTMWSFNGKTCGHLMVKLCCIQQKDKRRNSRTITEICLWYCNIQFDDITKIAFIK